MTKKNETHSPDLSAEELAELIKELKHLGYLLPTSNDELESFNEIYGATKVIFPEHLKNPDFLFKKKDEAQMKIASIKKENTKDKKTSKTPLESEAPKTYFKNLVLAAEIANQLYNEPTFGHVKFVKIFCLCNEVCNMKLNLKIGRYAAGPLDPKTMYSIDGEFKKRKWFSVKKSEYGYKYEPLENSNAYKLYYERYFKNEKERIDSLIELFRKKNSDFCEIVATLFFVWKKLIEDNTIVNNPTLINGFYSWSKEKARFIQSEVEKRIEWMNENQIIPK